MAALPVMPLVLMLLLARSVRHCCHMVLMKNTITDIMATVSGTANKIPMGTDQKPP
jgi:hypothetical protein